MSLKVRHKELPFPLFFPDATHATIKGVGTDDLKSNGINNIVVNTYHLIKDKKVDVIKSIGGIHKFMDFDGIVISDSGGFQAMSLVRNKSDNGKISKDGVEFELDNEKINLTPKSCIQTQIDLGSDIIMCLDDCTDPEESLKEQEISVERTIDWAKLCKDEFDRLTKDIKDKPLLFAIIQGGNSKRLRKKCARSLIEMGFDGYAYGGWPVDGKGKFLSEILDYTAKLMSDELPKYAMGVGKPEDIIECISYGYNMFDCVLPSRDARHKRLYVFDDTSGTNYHFEYMQSGKHEYSFEPIDDNCTCTTCKRYTKSYLWHLFRVRDPLSLRLATIHNLRFYQELMERLIAAGISI